jgi:hypothetical protein
MYESTWVSRVGSNVADFVAVRGSESGPVQAPPPSGVAAGLWGGPVAGGPWSLHLGITTIPHWRDPGTRPRRPPTQRSANVQRFDAAAFAAGGKACKPRILGIGAASGHHEHRSPRTRVATDARGWRSTFRRSIARLVPQPEQNTSRHGVPAISAARIVGDHSMSRLTASCSFQRSTTAFAPARAAASATCRLALVAMSRPRVRTPIVRVCLAVAANPSAAF